MMNWLNTALTIASLLNGAIGMFELTTHNYSEAAAWFGAACWLMLLRDPEAAMPKGKV